MATSVNAQTYTVERVIDGDRLEIIDQPMGYAVGAIRSAMGYRICFEEVEIDTIIENQIINEQGQVVGWKKRNISFETSSNDNINDILDKIIALDNSYDWYRHNDTDIYVIYPISTKNPKSDASVLTWTVGPVNVKNKKLKDVLEDDLKILDNNVFLSTLCRGGSCSDVPDRMVDLTISRMSFREALNELLTTENDLVWALGGLSKRALSITKIEGRNERNLNGTYTVERVIDGDTLKLTNGEIVELIGIDAPESEPNAKAKRDAERTGQDLETITKMGQEATEFVKKLVPETGAVRLEFDVQEKDRYGRLLAYVWCPSIHIGGHEITKDGVKEVDEDTGEWMLNEAIIAEGYASPMTIPPNVKYAELFEELYKEAREQKMGLWKNQEGDNCSSDTDCSNILCEDSTCSGLASIKRICNVNKCLCFTICH